MKTAEKKQAFDRTNYQRQMREMVVVVQRDELKSLKTMPLTRVAKHLGVSVKRVTGKRGFEDIRRDVVAQWPDGCESLTIGSEI
jgi:hypothetical protein